MVAHKTVPHSEKVKELLGPETVEILSCIFETSSGIPPTVPAKRFRADHANWISQINKLEQDTRLIEFDYRANSATTYRVTCHALPLINNSEAEQLLDQMEKVFPVLQAHYKDKLDEPLPVRAILNSKGLDKKVAKTALAYMRDVSGWWSSLGADFPSNDSSSIQVNEEVLLMSTFSEFISRYYEWSFLNPRKHVAPSFPALAGISRFSFFPNQSSKPDWYEELDDSKKGLIQEIETGINSNLLALPTMGLRTLIESIMVDYVGENGGFKAKLDKFEAGGFIARKHATMIDTVLDTGNAAAHRAYFPNKEDLATCVAVVRYLMEGLYVLDPKLKQVSENTPPRPKSKP